MKLTHKHLQIIHDGIIKLDCQSCSFVKDCYAHEKIVMLMKIDIVEKLLSG